MLDGCPKPPRLVLVSSLLAAVCLPGCWLFRDLDACSVDEDCPDGHFCVDNRGINVCLTPEYIDAGGVGDVEDADDDIRAFDVDAAPDATQDLTAEVDEDSPTDRDLRDESSDVTDQDGPDTDPVESDDARDAMGDRDGPTDIRDERDVVEEPDAVDESDVVDEPDPIDEPDLVDEPDTIDEPDVPTEFELTVQIVGSGVGTVLIEPGAVDCDDECSSTLPAGSGVTLTAEAFVGSALTSWAGATCAAGGDPSVCELSLSADLTVQAFIDIELNLVFVSSTTHIPGEIGGLDGADLICNQLASIAGLPGSYVAWLSTSTVDAVDRLSGARGWIRRDGLPFADQVADLVAGEVYYPVALDEDGQLVDDFFSQGGPAVLTGTGSDGTGIAGDGGYCSDWDDVAATDGYVVGHPIGATRSWTNFWSPSISPPTPSFLDCSGVGQHLLCFGVDVSIEVVVPEPTGRIVFASDGTITGDAGRDAADTLCNDEADDWGFAGDFLAFMSDSTDGAGFRFSIDLEGPWYRPDGVQVWEDVRQMRLDSPFAPIGVTASTQYVDDGVFTGGPDPTSAGHASCGDWTMNSGMAIQGRTSLGGVANGFVPNFFSGQQDSCGEPARVYCVQN